MNELMPDIYLDAQSLGSLEKAPIYCRSSANPAEYLFYCDAFVLRGSQDTLLIFCELPCAEAPDRTWGLLRGGFSSPADIKLLDNKVPVFLFREVKEPKKAFYTYHVTILLPPKPA